MRKFLALILMLSLCLLLPASAYCQITANNWGYSDRTILLGRELTNDLIYRGAGRDGVSTIASTVSTLGSTHLSFGILLLTGATKTFTMDAGEVGQEITLIKDAYDPRVLVLSFDIANPDTAHTGFTTVTWPTASGGFVTLSWLDSTRGWFITGAYDVTIAR